MLQNRLLYRHYQQEDKLLRGGPRVQYLASALTSELFLLLRRICRLMPWGRLPTHPMPQEQLLWPIPRELEKLEQNQKARRL